MYVLFLCRRSLRNVGIVVQSGQVGQKKKKYKGRFPEIQEQIAQFFYVIWLEELLGMKDAKPTCQEQYRNADLMQPIEHHLLSVGSFCPEVLKALGPDEAEGSEDYHEQKE